jgi:hypothetical protein
MESREDEVKKPNTAKKPQLRRSSLPKKMAHSKRGTPYEYFKLMTLENIRTTARAMMAYTRPDDMRIWADRLRKAGMRTKAATVLKVLTEKKRKK